MWGQVPYMDHQPEISQFLDRVATLYPQQVSHTSIRKQNLQYLLDIDGQAGGFSTTDQTLLSQIHRNIPEQSIFSNDTINRPKVNGFFNHFYRDSGSMWTVNEPNFFLKVDPLIHFELGDDFSNNGSVFQNTRGLRLRGVIDKKIFFYTSILENQQGFLNYVDDEITRLNSIPGQGFFKPYQSKVIDGIRGWDFLNSQAYFGFNLSPSIDVHFGHGRNFIGNGIRSMLLSDYGHNYLYLQLNTRVWKFHYQNTFASLSTVSSKDIQGDQLLPQKYLAAHYLSLQINDRLSIGLFESVVFSRENSFELNYLNPLILYRSAEQFLDSPDNVLLGLNTNWNFKKGWQLYGQLMIDELKISEAFGGKGWWGNKIGYQVGLKKFDLFSVSNLDGQIEHNTARPYTYAHRASLDQERSTGSYSHHNQALAHPLGANFRETIIRLTYTPNTKVSFSGLYHRAQYGIDPNNNGRNILLNYQSRIGDFGQFTGQGSTQMVNALHLTSSWQFYNNFFLDLRFIMRHQSADEAPPSKTNYMGVGLRVNLHNRPFLF